jgi:hypothetical protein
VVGVVRLFNDTEPCRCIWECSGRLFILLRYNFIVLLDDSSIGLSAFFSSLMPGIARAKATEEEVAASFPFTGNHVQFPHHAVKPFERFERLERLEHPAQR